MANITQLQTDFFYGQFERPTAANPRLSSGVVSTDTTLTFTNALLDEDGNVPILKILLGIRSADTGYTETIYLPNFVTTGDIANTSPIVQNIPSTTGMVAGMKFTATGVPTGTAILSVDSATQVTLTQNATATTVGVALTVSSLSVDGKTAYGVTRGIALSGSQGTDFTTGTASLAVDLRQDSQVRNNISALSFQQLIDTMRGVLSNGGTSWKIGDGTDQDITVEAHNADANKPYFRYDKATNAWIFSNDGVSSTPFGTGAGVTGGNGIDITAGNISVDLPDTTTFVSTSSGAADNGLLARLNASGQFADGFVNTKKTVNAQTGTTYTLVLTDANKVVTMTNVSAQTLTVPTNASVAFATDTIIQIVSLGAGVLSIVGDTGVTINGVSAPTIVLAKDDQVILQKTGTDTWTSSTVSKSSIQYWSLDTYDLINWDSNYSDISAGQYTGNAVTLNKSVSVSSVTFYIGNQALATGSLTAKIYAATGAVGSTAIRTGAVLGTSTAVPMSIFTGITPVTFIFGTPVALTAGDYVLSWEPVFTTGTVIKSIENRAPAVSTANVDRNGTAFAWIMPFKITYT